MPSGASTGSAEAVELRDGNPARYLGSGVRGAVGHVNAEINDVVAGRDWNSLAEVDATLIEL